MTVYEKMDVIVRTHDAYVDNINEKINSHAITTNDTKKELVKAVNAFYDELRQQDRELSLLATTEQAEDMTDSFSCKVVEYYYDKYERFLKYLDD